MGLLAFLLVLLVATNLKVSAQNDYRRRNNEQPETQSIIGDIIDNNKIKEIKSNVDVLFTPSIFELTKYKLDQLEKFTEHPKFNKDLPTVVYVHGWIEDGEDEKSVMAVRGAYHDRGGHNIITIDWSHYSKLNFPFVYKTPIQNLKVICEVIAEKLEEIRKARVYNHEKIYLVGHSLGGQCVGLVGRHLRKISKGEYVMPRIYALDAAGPGFEFLLSQGTRGFDSITKTDGLYVQLIHTSGGVYGVKNPNGHADFFVNGGTSQSGCITQICCHQRSWVYFQESLRNHYPLLGVKCDSYKAFQSGNCNYDDIAEMGMGNETQPMGTYYLNTHPNLYGTSLVRDGLYDRKLLITQYDPKTNSHTRPSNSFRAGLDYTNDRSNSNES